MWALFFNGIYNISNPCINIDKERIIPLYNIHLYSNSFHVIPILYCFSDILCLDGMQAIPKEVLNTVSSLWQKEKLQSYYHLVLLLLQFKDSTALVTPTTILTSTPPMQVVHMLIVTKIFHTRMFSHSWDTTKFIKSYLQGMVEDMKHCHMPPTADPTTNISTIQNYQGIESTMILIPQWLLTTQDISLHLAEKEAEVVAIMYKELSGVILAPTLWL